MDDICDNVNYVSSPRALSYVRESKQGKKVLKHMNKVLRNLSKLGITSSDVPRKGVMVGNVGHGTGLQEAELLRACLPFGAVQAVVMVPGMAYCFVVFADLAGAERAYSALHGQRNPVSPNLPVLYLAYVDSVPGCDSVCKFDLKPPGLLLYEDFVTDAEEESLLNCVDWTNTSCHSGKVLKQRRVKHYGYEFRYDTNNVDKDCPLPEGIPPECDFLWPRLRQRGCDVGTQPPDQLTVNHYEPGHGIPQHVDTHSAFEDPIMSLSLGASVVMDFKHLDGRHAAVVLPRRSLLVMLGEARLAWSHGITARKTDVMPSAGGGLVVQDRSARTSFTFRHIRHGECRCEHRDQCDSHQRRSTAALEAAGTDEMAAGLESQHVHKVYEKIADHFSETRHKPWPNVLAFVQSFPPGAVLLDVGCGNAKYFARNTKVFQVGCDTSTGLARVCRERGFEVLTANCLQLPFRSGFADCCISIAVIHHLASQVQITMSGSKNKKSTFNPQWLNNHELAAWVSPCATDRFSIFCRLCKKNVLLSNMGKQALTSHLKGQKHILTKCGQDTSYNIRVFTTKKHHTSQSNEIRAGPSKETVPETTKVVVEESAVNEPVITSEQSQPILKSQKRGLETFLIKENITKAEILWCLQNVSVHASMSAAGKTTEIFAAMFPDSEIAKGLVLGRAKMAYTIVYGLGPYFQFQARNDVPDSDCFAVSFDESFNKVSQTQQMDFVFRYWSKEKDEVVSRYMGSAFLGHTTSSDLLAAFRKELASFNLKHMIQIAMDGPNVNLKFFRDLKKELHQDPDDPVVLDIGTCGLHSLHNSFKVAIKSTEWNIVEFLRAIYNIFKNVPARRSDYVSFSGSTKFPKKFCAIRWLQNIEVASRAQEILKHLQEYVKVASSKKKEPVSACYQIMKKYLEGELLGPKLAFFKVLASEVEPFLTAFQAEQPMAPFLYGDLLLIVTNVMARFVKKEVMEKAKNVVKININISENLIDVKKVDVGYETREAIRKVVDYNPNDILLFKRDCLECLQAFWNKLLDRSPLTFALTRGLSICDPKVISAGTEVASKRLKLCLEIFVENKWITGICADKLERNFKSLCLNPIFAEKSKTYSRETRLDYFWKDVL